MNSPPQTEDLLVHVRALCMKLPEVTENLTHGAPTWFVRGRRSFLKFVDPAAHNLDETHVAFWAAAAPGVRHELAAADPYTFFTPRFGGSDWVGMRLDLEADGPDWEEVREIVLDAYRCVAPKTLVARLDADPGL
ncbi:MmcQ/YjbR family DNA-binding protein [Streptomyces winkii]|uniref:MmcQ/YjbR family DNA-binding protein n=1 Tax=Streptomyces winkii TaxID=3051178 RepID=UPI0028D1BA6E|nr:MmcQ/YjbR family DNA-binding protein [Streptomyces sp. DSM 40971]